MARLLAGSTIGGNKIADTTDVQKVQDAVNVLQGTVDNNKFPKTIYPDDVTLRVYVDAVNGVDAANVSGKTMQEAFKTLGYAISRIPKLSVGAVQMYLKGTFNEALEFIEYNGVRLYINGVVEGTTRAQVKSAYFQYTNAYVILSSLDVLEGVSISHSRGALLTDVAIHMGGTTTQGIAASGTSVVVRSASIQGKSGTTAVWANEGAHVYLLAGCSGSGHGTRFKATSGLLQYAKNGTLAGGADVMEAGGSIIIS